MKIILIGGGTLGPVTPLLALVDAIKEKKPDTEFLWIGTRNGLERGLVGTKKIEFKAIYSGKWRRYFSLRNFLDICLVKIGAVQSFFILLKYKPNVIISAGGFVAVPVCFAGWILKIPIVIHQQDIQPGLANKLCAPFAAKITVAFEKSLKDFSKNKAVWVGNPAREEILKGKQEKEDLPKILAIGGGTGSEFLNDLVVGAIPELTKFCEIIHITGGKIEHQEQDRYHPHTFLAEELASAYATADVVVSRAGMGVLTELAALGKPSILIPLPGHQEKNARYFEEKDAAIVLMQNEVSKEVFVGVVKKLLEDRGLQGKLRDNIRDIFPRNSAKKLAEVVLRTKED